MFIVERALAQFNAVYGVVPPNKDVVYTSYTKRLESQPVYKKMMGWPSEITSSGEVETTSSSKELKVFNFDL